MLGVDIDNVLSLTDPAIRRLVHEEFGISLAQEQIVHYEYHLCGITREQELRVLEIFRDVTCSELALVPYAAEALRLLERRYRIVIVTSRHPSIREKTLDWLTVSEIPYDSIVFQETKHQTGQSFDFFVEDHAGSAVALAGTGTRTFLFDYPWNRDAEVHPNITRVSGWREVVAELL
jgi:uncharacterized HAD superfamily protein